MSSRIVDRPSGALRMLGDLYRRYPWRSSVVLGALLVASVLDGLGLSTLLSLINLADAAGSGGQAVLVGGDDASLPERMIAGLLQAVGLEPTLFVLLLLGAGLVLGKTAIVLLANRQVGYAVAQVATDLRIDLLRAIGASRWRYYLSKPVGTLTNAMATEAQRSSEGFLQGAVMATQLITAAIYMVVAFLISWQVTLAAMVLTTGVLAGLHVFVRAAGRAGRRQTGLLKTILSVMTDQLAAIKPLKAMGREEQFDALMSMQTRELNRSLRKQVFSKEAIRALQEAAVVILAILGLFIMLGVMNMELAAVMMLIFVLARMVSLLSKTQRAWQLTEISESAYWSLIDAIDEARAEREQRSGRLTPSLDRGIHLDHVAFAHPGVDVFEDLELTIPAGRLTVITGPSGSGKTTLVDLVAGLLRPDRGRVLVDDVDLEAIDQAHWRSLIGYVPQDPLLVNDSVINNITLGAPDLSRADVERALDQADALDFVNAMAEGLDSAVGEKGGRLSGGQRQRIALARALVHRPSLLILDEATSSLDRESELAVLATVDNLKGYLTLLAVTHQQPMLERADHAWRLSEGVLMPADLVSPASGRLEA
jgi:ATP-binding cassette subfamily C protein